MLQSSTLRPGLLVSLSCTITGNVRYTKRDLESEITPDGVSIAKWETERTIADLQEHNAGSKARADARNAIAGACTHSAFGLLCPEAKADQLESAIAKARGIADAFNATARLSRLNVYVLTGRIAPDDVEAVRAINSEIRGLMATMESGLRNLDVKTVREAANKARAVGAMLAPDAESRVKEAVALAREAAIKIRKAGEQAAVALAREAAIKIRKAGEQAAVAIDTETVARIATARVSFLDLGEAQEVESPVTAGRSLDLSDCGSDDIAAPVLRSASVNMES